MCNVENCDFNRKNGYVTITFPERVIICHGEKILVSKQIKGVTGASYDDEILYYTIKKDNNIYYEPISSLENTKQTGHYIVGMYSEVTLLKMLENGWCILKVFNKSETKIIKYHIKTKQKVVFPMQQYFYDYWEEDGKTLSLGEERKDCSVYEGDLDQFKTMLLLKTLNKDEGRNPEISIMENYHGGFSSYTTSYYKMKMPLIDCLLSYIPDPKSITKSCNVLYYLQNIKGIVVASTNGKVVTIAKLPEGYNEKMFFYYDEFKEELIVVDNEGKFVDYFKLKNLKDAARILNDTYNYFYKQKKRSRRFDELEYAFYNLLIKSECNMLKRINLEVK